MSPDPSHKSDGRQASEDSYMSVPIANGEEDIDISYEGYEVLPQDFNENNVESDIEPQDCNSEDDISSSAASSTFDQATKVELTELWNSSYTNRISDIIMDTAKEEMIKNAMAGFNLPSTSIPQWAKNIPEDQWKQQILNRINASDKM